MWDDDDDGSHMSIDLSSCTIVEMEEEKLIPKLLPYVDKHVAPDTSPFVRHFLCHQSIGDSPFKKSVLNTCANLHYKHNLKEYNRCLKKKDFYGAEFWVEKPHKLKWFIRNYKKIYSRYGDKKYYSMLSDALTYVDYHYYTKQYYHKLISIGKDPHLMMDKKEMKKYDSLPDKFYIFRGVCTDWPLDDRRYLRPYIGNSWTLDKEKAIWFTQWLFAKKSPFRYLLKYMASKEEIIAYFGNRKEKEVLVDYKTLDYKRIEFEELSVPPKEELL